MADFPLLTSGAVMQYPAQTSSGKGVQVITFLDGTDQRHLTQGRSFRQWRVQLDLLNDVEMAAIETFFTELSGNYSPFTFPDPFTGTPVANCRLGTPAIEFDCRATNIASASFWVIETNG